MSQSENIIDQLDVGLVLVVHRVVFTISTSVVPQAEQRHMGPHGIVSIGCPSRRTSNYQSHGT
ncbi:unnamed protein product [Fusarium graminearum]|uniref:Uncharacterized protein n=1 Tax=Gibberella zeae TaxID=5518 RepID=A0A4E9EBK1_GIBZA|nr:unnamed protein product [Fusarium graminearum]